MIKAVLFDLDGVLVDTERDGHRVACNKTFAEYNLDAVWDQNLYHDLLSIAGGKERIAHYFKHIVKRLPVEEDAFDTLVKGMHVRKTEILINMLESGELPLRCGVKRFIEEIVASGKKIALCTTSNKNFAEHVLKFLLGDIHFDVILAGDVVSKKKPDPEIYNMALERLAIDPQEALVVEDSMIGVEAAHVAGIKVLATTNVYTEKEDLSKATIIVDCLGDEEHKVRITKPSEYEMFGQFIRFVDIG